MKVVTTTTPRLLRSSIVGLCALTMCQCNGTEADNPFAEPVEATPCKSHEEYTGLAAGKGATSLHGPKGTQNTSDVSLSDAASVPVWLECVEWSRGEEVLQLQIVNFRGGCAVDWRGEAYVAGQGEVVVDLQNESCEVAGCGNCLYDLRTSVPLPAGPSSAALDLQLVRRDCEGQSTLTSDWTLPVDARDDGMSCRRADSWGANAAFGDAPENVERELYRPCGDADGDDPLLDGARVETCAAPYSCEQGRCVAPCNDDADCPLPGAFTCQDGACVLPE